MGFTLFTLVETEIFDELDWYQYRSTFRLRTRRHHQPNIWSVLVLITAVSSFSIHLPFIRRYSFSKLRFLLVNLDFGTAFCTFSIFECCSILELVLFCLIQAPLTSLVKRNSRRTYKFYAPCSFVFLVLTLLLHILVY